MNDALKNYLSKIPGVKELNDSELRSYKKEMSERVIPGNLRTARDQKRAAHNARLAAAISAAKRESEDAKD